jgi:LCP family protein required for cell wall assembly
MSGPAASAGSETEDSARWRGFWGRLVIAVLIASACMTSAVALVDRGITDKVTEIPRVVGLTLAPSPPGGANYLIIGSDTRAFVDNENDALQFGDPNRDPDVEGQRSDTLMVAHVEPSAQRTFVVSFPRDLMVNVPGTPGLSMINSAYSSGGPQLVVDTLKANFGIDISHYLEVDFKSFREIVNTIGNVQVYLPGRVRDAQLGMLSPYGGGCYTVDGESALAYVRSRKLEISDPNGDIVDPDTGEHWRLLDVRADLDRIDRQQRFIRKLAGLAISRALGDPFLALDLTNNVLEYIHADEALSRDNVNQLVRAFRTLDVNDPNAVRFETLPVEQYEPDPNRLIASPAADAVIAQLNTFGDDTPKVPALQPSQVTVRVTDASGTNAAENTVKALADQGFQASKAKDAAAGVAVTEIHYTYGQADEAKLMLTYFPDAKLVPDVAAKHAVTVVLGTSFPGTITVPSTTTTAPSASTVPGAPVATEPATTAPPPTTAASGLPADPCG